jgi:hypothetical protein
MALFHDAFAKCVRSRVCHIANTTAGHNLPQHLPRIICRQMVGLEDRRGFSGAWNESGYRVWRCARTFSAITLSPRFQMALGAIAMNAKLD